MAVSCLTAGFAVEFICVDTVYQNLRWIPLLIVRTGLIHKFILAEHARPLLGDHCQQEASDPSQEIQAIVRDGLAQYVSRFVVPVPAFAS